jgi:hypothetical protein
MQNNQDPMVRTRQMRAAYGSLYDTVLEILQRHDPLGIGMMPDEYEPEVDTILPRLNEAHSPADLRRIVHEEFIWWFSDADATIEEKRQNHDAGPEEDYELIAQEIWESLKQRGV